jgi:hypothetical protein
MRRLALACAAAAAMLASCGGTTAGDPRIVGIWRWQSDAAGELLLTPEKTFSQAIYWNGLMTYDTGIYDTGEGFVHFAVQQHQPVVYGPNGSPMAYVTSFTYFYTFVDDNHVVFSDHIVNTSWDAYRVQ